MVDAGRMFHAIDSSASRVQRPADWVSMPALAPRVRDAFLWLSVAAAVPWSLHVWMISPGVTTHDAIAHFIISREAWHRPALMLHHWGRPIDTIVYMPAAFFGLEPARVTSLILAALTVLLTVRLAQRLSVECAFAVPLLLLFQPWFLQLSGQPALTEIPFSLLMALSAWLFVSQRFLLATIVIGLFPLIRIEAIALTWLWIVVCAVRKDWRGVVIALLPIAAYAVLHRGVLGQLPGGAFPIIPGIGSVLGHAHLATHRALLWLPKSLGLGVGLPVAALAAYAIPLLLRSTPRLAVFGWYGAYFLLHFVLYRIGYTSGLDQRYLFPLAPAAALAAGLGLGMIMDEFTVSVQRLLGPRHAPAAMLRYAILAICAGAVFAAGLRTLPIPFDADATAAKAAAGWLRQQGLDDGHIVSSHVYLHYFLPGHLKAFRPGEGEGLWLYDPRILSESPSGTIAIWDSRYSEHFGLPYSALTSPPGRWVMLKEFRAAIPSADIEPARFIVFRKGQP